jgi:hypothetical protein
MSTTASSSPPAQPGPLASAARQRWRRALQGELGLAAAAGLLALLAAAIVLRLWHAQPAVPLGYGGDGLWVQQIVKGMIDHGWFWTNPDLGAPFEQQLYDFTGVLGDNAHFTVMKAMSLLSHDAVKVVNAYFLLGFFLCAASACLVLRRLGISRGAAVVAAVLFSLLPAHVGGGVGRLMLGEYWAIPLTALLLIKVFAGEPLFARRPSAGRLTRWASRQTLATVGMCVLIAISGLYYTLFTVLLLVLAGGAVLLTRGALKTSQGAGVAAAIVLAIFLIQVSPNIVYSHEHGPNDLLSQRNANDSSVYATSLALLTFPVIGHRWDRVAELRERLQAAKQPPGPNENDVSALGLVGSLGFLGLLLAAVVPDVRRARERAGPAAATALLAFLLGTAGGIGLFVALLVTPDLRAWGRISPLLGFLGLFAAALAYDALSAWTAGRRSWLRYGVPALLPLALAFGVWDQTTATMIPSYGQVRAEYHSDARFVSAIESRLPAGSAVLQLPAVPFPESGQVVNMADYSHMRGTLHAKTLRFSYGAMKGRPGGDWAARLSAEPAAKGLPYYVAAGMRGIWVDRRGYADQGAAVDSELRALLGSPQNSEDGQLRFYFLVDYARDWLAGRSARQRRAARDAALHLTNVVPAAGITAAPETGSLRIADPAAGGSLVFSNPGRLARTILVRGRLVSDGATTDVEAQLPGGDRASLRATPGGRAFAFRVRVAAEQESRVRLVASGTRTPLKIAAFEPTDDALSRR